MITPSPRRPGSPPAALPLSPLLTVTEVARQLVVSVKTVRRLIHRRELHAYRVGRSVRISATALSAYLNGIAKLG